MAWISATYVIESTPSEIKARSEALALEQSVEMPLAAVADPHIRETIVGRVAAIEPIDGSRFRVQINLATATTGGDPVQLTNMLFGNCSLQDDVQLEDVDLPPSFVERFKGPRFGIAGLRKLLGAPQRPLTCTALKPQGSSVQTLAELCETFARAGIDVIKDDHGIADQAYAPFGERVAACQAAVRRASESTGKAAFYAPSLVGSPRRINEQAQLAREAGVKIVLLAPMLLGIGALAEFSEAFPELAILAHPAFGGTSRVSPVWLFGRFFRLLGADAVIYPNYGGRFAYSRDVCSAIARAAREPWGNIRAAIPVPAGGMPVERVDEMLEFYGDDVMLLIGGSLLSAGAALAERSRTFVAAVERGV
jgi:ribulose-bisphosphate carboxylase large chain